MLPERLATNLHADGKVKDATNQRPGNCEYFMSPKCDIRDLLIPMQLRPATLVRALLNRFAQN